MERAENKTQGDQTPEATSDQTLKDIEETQKMPDDQSSSANPSPDGEFDEGRERDEAGSSF